jgi:mevalonate kinase
MSDILPIEVKAPGKVILFGEHAVVYGQPAISIAIDIFSRCLINFSSDQKNHLILKDFEIDIEFTSITNLMERLHNKFKQFGYGIQRMLELRNISIQEINKKGFINIEINSELWKGSGLGSSASTSIAFIKALSILLDIQFEDSEINEIIFSMEKIVHKNPSGIDNHTILHEGFLFYEKGNFRTLNIYRDYHFLIIYSGIPHDTGKVIEKVKSKKMNNENELINIFEDIGNLSRQFIKYISKKAIISNETLNKLINSNHILLKEIGVSNEIIEDIRNSILRNYNVGVKLTGAGLGGCIICNGTLEELRRIKVFFDNKKYASKIVNIYNSRS